MENVFGVVMAGGGGTRFWPLSRKASPKQLLNLSGKEVMVNEAVDRLAQVTAYKNIYLVTNCDQAEKMRTVTAGRVRAEHILAEPAARNTAACIGYAAMKIVHDMGDGILVVTPSDAYIRDNAAFSKTLEQAIEAAQTGKLVTIGITPTFPATGYGYIRFTESDGAAKPVEQFVEKPPREMAEEYLASGGYVWNSGMFVWRASVILQKIESLLPELYAGLEKIAAALGTPDEVRVSEEVYPTLPSISVDYGILEHSRDILVVPGEFGWSDVGSWDMLGTLHPADENGNVAVGDTLGVAIANTVLYSSGRLVAAVGVEDLVVVETPDAVLVCRKSCAQDVKKIVEKLQAEGREELL